MRNSCAGIPKYGPLSVAAGAVSRLPLVANSSGQYHFFVGPAAGTCMHNRKKKRTQGWSREKKSVPKENHSRKQTAATPKWPWPINRVRKGWDGRFRVLEAHETWQSSSSWRESSSTTVQTIWWKRHASAFETGRFRQVHYGDIRQQVLRIDEDRLWANSQHHRRRLSCWTTTIHFADVKETSIA